MNRTYGTVSIIGAGPGDPELITVKALRRIQQADVIMYDRLVNDELLTYARPDAQRLFCGKAPGLHHMNQATIHRTLLAYASAGHTVVRLKGGDPLVFGRGAEEALFLAEHHIPYEIVPGITSAIGTAASASIPLTHRGVATSFACITVCRANQAIEPVTTESVYASAQTVSPAPVRWDLLAHSVDTLAIYMGVSQLEEICSELICCGKPSTTPVAIIENGTTEAERILTGTLADIAQIATTARVSNPAMIIIGEVVHIREQLLQMKNQAHQMIG